MIIKVIGGLVVALFALVGLGWLGTRIDLPGFAAPADTAGELGSVEPPTGLPAPVARYVEAAFAGRIPLVTSAIITGRVDVRFNGIPFPARFKLYHEAGKAYYHYIQMGWFGLPVATVNERYLNGVGTMDIPGSFIDNDPSVNAAANLGLWAESIWLPSIWFTDGRVRWEAVDEHTARLILPDAAPEEAFTLRFDPATGLITSMDTLRYQNAGDVERLPWKNRVLAWEQHNGVMVPSLADIRWGDDPPWATWHVEHVRYNVDVAARLAHFGGADPDQ